MIQGWESNSSDPKTVGKSKAMGKDFEAMISLDAHGGHATRQGKWMGTRAAKVFARKQKTFDQPQMMKYDYHDYASDPCAPRHQTELHFSKKASQGGVSNPFPVVLHKLLSEADGKGFSNFISWQPHGRCFLIHQPKAFVREIIPLYFKHSKLSSFQRQLALYGFVRLCKDSPDKGSYFHEFFLRGRPHLCTEIHRTRVKGTWVRSSASPESEPNFYAMDPVLDKPPREGESSMAMTRRTEDGQDAVTANPISPYTSSQSGGSALPALNRNVLPEPPLDLQALGPATECLNEQPVQAQSPNFESFTTVSLELEDEQQVLDLSLSEDHANPGKQTSQRNNLNSTFRLSANLPFSHLSKENSFFELGVFLRDSNLDFKDEFIARVEG